MNYSILRECPAPRPLAIALAHYATQRRIGRDDAQMRIVNRLYKTLKPVQQLEFHAERHACNAAKRGELEAQLAG